MIPTLSKIELEARIHLMGNDRLQKLNIDLPISSLAISYDMGWQERPGGRVYDSISGHGFLVGCCSQKVVYFGILKKVLYLRSAQPDKLNYS